MYGERGEERVEGQTKGSGPNKRRESVKSAARQRLIRCLCTSPTNPKSCRTAGNLGQVVTGKGGQESAKQSKSKRTGEKKAYRSGVTRENGWPRARERKARKKPAKRVVVVWEAKSSVD